MSNRHQLVIHLAAVLFFFSSAAHVYGIILTVEPPTQNAEVGNIVDVSVAISGLGAAIAPSLGGFALDVSFDPTVLSFNGVFFGDAVLGDQLDLGGSGSIIVFVADSSSVFLSELSLASANDLNTLQADSFTLAKLSFNAIGAGTSSIGLSKIVLSDQVGDSLEPEVFGGTVTVTSNAAVPEPVSLAIWSMLGLTGVGLAGWRRRRRAP